MRLSFDGALYTEAALKAAAEAFAGWARFRIERVEGRLDVTAEPAAAPLPPEFEEEFANHALAEMAR
jgi:hypothetical protein